MEIKKYLSYLFPLTEKVRSVRNGVLEIKWLNGRKILDSAHANYSYGSLQRILETGLSAAGTRGVNPILLLGLGGGSVIRSLRSRFKYWGHITAVEADPVVINIARHAFDITGDVNLEIVCADALAFVDEQKKTYGLIIVDIFIDDRVPPVFMEKSFCENLARLARPGGKLLFNLGLEKYLEETPFPAVFFNAAADFDTEVLHKVENSNALLIARRSAPSEC